MSYQLPMRLGAVDLLTLGGAKLTLSQRPLLSTAETTSSLKLDLCKWQSARADADQPRRRRFLRC